MILWLILGLLVGFYARQVYDMLKDVYEDFTYRREATRAGVVRPAKTQLTTRNQPQDMSANKDSGIIMRPSPNMVGMSRLAAEDERNKKLSS